MFVLIIVILKNIISAHAQLKQFLKAVCRSQTTSVVELLYVKVGVSWKS